MQYIDVLKNNKSIQKLPFANKTYLIGRLPYSDIYLDSTDILPEQAKIVIGGQQQIQIYDMGVSGKLYVNDRQIKSTLLNLKDIIRIGDYMIRFIEMAEDEKKRSYDF